ncbi:hypothetical protein NDU88_000875 [Pleurodeles waltl]|uniref:Uncharacterized protein n=1 Tax=Pleurodeles waltl TaxID=8319 RepID=A0AAV7TGP8_PLEWA|nr:hypothetical protein NDU88_000875 [Pleurodeles waltl]
MLRTPCACSTDCCGRSTALWRPLKGLWPRRQAPEGPARRCERGARSRTTLLLIPIERDPRRFLAVVVGVWGVWGVWHVRMAPKLSRTPRSLRARQNQDPGGTRKDKKLPVPGLKEHSNFHMMRIKKRSTENGSM